MADGQAKRLELLKKLKALADNGVGGERENAQAMLDKLLAKYDISAETLSDDEVSDHGFTYHSDFERRLLSQLRAKIATNRDAFRYKYGKGARSTFYCTCTEAEALQIQIEFEFYAALWKEEQETFFGAFIQKHQIFDTKPGCETMEFDEETATRMGAMMKGMQDKTLNPMLEDGDRDESDV